MTLYSRNVVCHVPLTPSDKIQGAVLAASAQMIEPGAAELGAVLVALTPYVVVVVVQLDIVTSRRTAYHYANARLKLHLQKRIN